jgi:protein-tyrosine phosphatase
MAEFIFKDMINKKGISDDFLIRSSATSSEEIWNGIGNPVYPPAKKILLSHGISCEGKRAVQLTKSDYNKYDLFIAMDNMNVRNIHRIFGKDPDKKVVMLMDYTGKKGQVSDPWYSGDFNRAYEDIYEGCQGLLKAFRKSEL